MPKNYDLLMQKMSELFSATARQFGFLYVEDAERRCRFCGNSSSQHYAQLLEEWSEEICYLFSEYWADSKGVSLDEFVSSLPPFDLNRVPVRVTMRQARSALLDRSSLPHVDKLAQIDAFIADAGNFSTPAEKRQVQIDWQYSCSVERNAAWVGVIGKALGYTDKDMDNLFRYAITLRA
jgi:hypothetical protein